MYKISIFVRDEHTKREILSELDHHYKNKDINIIENMCMTDNKYINRYDHNHSDEEVRYHDDIRGMGCKDIVENVKRYIQKNYHNKITVKDMAKYFSINANYLSTLFRDETGKTITQYLTETRINKAIYLLKNTEAGAAEIGQCVGYDDAQYFYRVFKKTTGRTTREYRGKN